MVEKLLGQTGVRAFVLGHDQQPRRILVDTVHQTGAQIALPEHRQRAQMIGQGIDQRPVPVAVARVHDHAGGLVDDQQIVVFVGDVERDVLRHDLDLALGIGHHHGDAVQRLDLVARLGRTSAHEHAAAVDRRLDAVARAVLHPQRIGSCPRSTSTAKCS